MAEDVLMLRRLFGFGTLGRYLVRQNLFLLLTTLFVITGIYLLSDVFDRLDNFISAGLGAGTILAYFAVKLPLIFSQILPAVFLLALVIQFGLLARSRELLALRAGGVATSWFVRFFVVYAIFWSLAVLAFSQYLGVKGQAEASRIWIEDVRKHQIDHAHLHIIWFRNGSYIVKLDEATPGKHTATGVTLYDFDPLSQRLSRIISAARASFGEKGWGLADVNIQDTSDFTVTHREQLHVPVEQDLQSFLVVDEGGSKADLPLWQLGGVIRDLERSGSNVEGLRTAWHGKLSYAFSILSLTLVGLALMTWSENLYANIGLSLVIVFLYYGMFVVGMSAGDKGLLAPVVAAWMGNVVFGAAGAARLFWYGRSHVTRRIRRRTPPIS